MDRGGGRGREGSGVDSFAEQADFATVCTATFILQVCLSRFLKVSPAVT